MTTTSDLLDGPAGISCARCGSLLPTGATLDGHAPGCGAQAAERARIVLGGSPPTLARSLAREAYAAGGAPAVAAVASQLEAMAAALRAGGAGGAP